VTVLLTTLGVSAYSQQVTPSGTGDKVDTLAAAVFVGRNQGNYLSKGKDLRTEVISSAGLMKMACCNLAESFENTVSVTVGYADATTGARQIRLLGLSGVYSQMLDENRPVLRGILAPFGLSYVPGPWLESIQVGKGAPSVVNGLESMTGTINLEHHKPTDGRPLLVNASVMNDTKTDVNIVSSLDLTDHLYTILMGHVDGNWKTHDMNGDGFADDPSQLQFNVSNRWLWYSPEVQVRWGVKAVRDIRDGGQISGPWASHVGNTLLNAYFKVGHAIGEEGSGSVALVGDWAYQKMDSFFGLNMYNGGQHSGFVNLLYRQQFGNHDVTAGVNATLDYIVEDIFAGGQAIKGATSRVLQAAPYAEYTFRDGDRLSIIAGISGLWLAGHGFYPAPRLTVKYQPFEALVLRANGGRGVRCAQPMTDNFGILSTGKNIFGDLTAREVEDSWTYGGNATFYFGEKTSFSLDYFRTQFTRQLLADRESPAAITLYTLDGHPSWSSNWQADFSTEPFDRFTVTLTGRYTDAKAWQPSGEVRELPMVSRYKALINLQYTFPANRWILDFTASVNGPARVYDFMRALKDENGALMYADGRTPVYPTLYAQVTRRFRGFDIYLGGENLTGYMQKHPIIDAGAPFAQTFDAASVWGPLMGAKLYVGFRVTIWK
jgi:hypothetical protein